MLPEVALPGSPERCIQRGMAEDSQGRLWVLERLHEGQAASRERIGRLLHELQRELPLLAPYRQTVEGAYVLQREGCCWQLSPYVRHEPLQRPHYLVEAGMGASLGSFLRLLRQAQLSEAALEEFPPPFSLPDYVGDLLRRMERVATQYAPRARFLAQSLSRFWDDWAELPLALCHGDCHPLNALWRRGRVAAIIDWEFCGPRPGLYDLANCLGCLGVEDPQALGGAFALGMLEACRETLLTGDEANHLPEFVLALRFAWLSEWLRHKDTPMVELELDYMELLSRRKGRLQQLWGL